jgi:hypothetical protein
MTITTTSIVSHVGMRFAGWVIACALCAYVMYRMTQMAMNEFTCLGDAPKVPYRLSSDRKHALRKAGLPITVASTAFVWTSRLLAPLIHARLSRECPFTGGLCCKSRFSPMTKILRAVGATFVYKM